VDKVILIYLLLYYIEYKKSTELFGFLKYFFYLYSKQLINNKKYIMYTYQFTINTRAVEMNQEVLESLGCVPIAIFEPTKTSQWWIDSCNYGCAPYTDYFGGSKFIFVSKVKLSKNAIRRKFHKHSGVRGIKEN